MKTATHSDAKVGVFTDSVEDDHGVMFPIMVTYDFHFYYSPFGREIMVTGFDVDYEGKIDKSTLNDIVKELISENEFNPVYFNI